MAEIVPAILEDSIEAFDSKQAEILKISDVRRIQVDISDGKFSPRRTVEVGDINLLNPAYFWEAHLMVENPQEHFFDAKIAGFNCAIFHWEAVSDKKHLPAMVQELKNLKLEAGLALLPETDVEEIYEYADIFDQIVLLEVHPGYQGQKMADDTLERIKKLKNHLKNVKIEVDGGVKQDNVKQLVQAGAELLIGGSSLFDAGPNGNQTPTQNFEKLTLETQNL